MLLVFVKWLKIKILIRVHNVIIIQRYYVVGRGRKRTVWKLFSIDRMEPSELNIFEDHTTYTTEECFDLLKRIHQGNRSMGGLKLISIGYGIVGKLSSLCYFLSFFLLSCQCFYCSSFLV